jgi:hypothetical protein
MMYDINSHTVSLVHPAHDERLREIHERRLFPPPRTDHRYRFSTFVLAQGVFLKNVKLDFMLGSLLKHLILIIRPSFSHPYRSTKRCSIISSVTP